MRSLLLSAFAPFVFVAGFAASAGAQTSATGYVVTQNNKQVGTSQFSSQPIAGGHTLHSNGTLQIDKFSYSFSNTTTVDAQYNLVRESLAGSVHGSKASGNNIQFDVASDATGRSFNIKINANGKATTSIVDRHRNMVMMPDLDPAAYSLLAKIALTKPQTAWVLIPKQDGILVPAEFQELSDLKGTLNGQGIAVKHIAVALSTENSLVVEIFYTAAGDLLEADLNAQGLRVSQQGFVLKDRPSPVPPPQNDAPTKDGKPQAGQQQNQPEQPLNDGEPPE